MKKEEVWNYLGLGLTAILENIGFEEFEYIDIIKPLNEIPPNFHLEADLDFYHEEAKRKGYRNLLILSKEKTEETYIHFCDMVIEYQNKFYLIKYSYRSDC
jgi:hypothetical protein